jgi:hypothetical protein
VADDVSADQTDYVFAPLGGDPTPLAQYLKTKGLGIAQSLAQLAMVPGQALQSTPDNPVTTDQLIQPAADMAMNMVGTPSGVGGLGAGARIPEMWHGISKVKLPRPIAEMSATHVPLDVPIAEKAVSPSDLQGGVLLPALGDRSVAGSNLTAVGDTSLANAVPMQGGHGYMAAMSPEGAVWASGESVASRLANAARNAVEDTGKPVYFPYTAMGERAVDFSHHVSDTLANMLANTAVGSKDIGAFNRAMKTPNANFGAIADFPGAASPQLADYLRAAPGDARNKFAKTMDTRRFQDVGFPSVAEARFAVTDPRLLNQPTGAAGLSISQLDPAAGVITSGTPHLTYPSKLAGEYLGGFGTSVPKEVMYPDMISAYRKLGYDPHQYDYLMARGVQGAPIYQRANQRWVDSVSKWLEQNQQ